VKTKRESFPFVGSFYKRQWERHAFCLFCFGSSAFIPLLRFVQMSRMTTEHWSLTASAECWSLVLFITLVALQRFCSLPSLCVCSKLHVHLFLYVFLKSGLKRDDLWCFRSGQTSFRNPKMEDLMWLRLMFSGTYTNQFEARFCSF